MRIDVLGSGASGGVPAWNDGSPAALETRTRAANATPWRRTATLAISSSRKRTSILEAPLHLPDTLAKRPELAPSPGSRATPIDSIVLTSTALEACAGLLGFVASLSIRILSPPGVRDALIDHH